MKLNFPNKLTVLRVILVPVYMILLMLPLKDSIWPHLLGGATFILCALTDFFDGLIARRLNMITDFGKFLDPLADKVLVVAAMLWFLQQQIIPAWAVLIVIVREFSITALRLIAVDNGRVIAAANLAKLKTATTMVCLIIMFLPIPAWLVTVFIILIVVTTLMSGVEYFIRNRDILKMTK